MTICIAVKVPEGIILAADGATVLHQEQTVFLAANKIAQIKDYPIGVSTWGRTHIYGRTIPNIILEYGESLPSVRENPNFSVRDIAEGLLRQIEPMYEELVNKEGNSDSIGLFLGGYSANKYTGELYECNLPENALWKEWYSAVPDEGYGVVWAGCRETLDRLIKCEGNILPISYNTMPLGDAVDFADYLAQVTIGRYRYTNGIPLCGGDVDIAVITPNLFRWSRRKQWTLRE